MEQDKLLKVDNTIEKLCDFLQKETECVASIYESQELTEMTSAQPEQSLISFPFHFSELLGMAVPV